MKINIQHIVLLTISVCFLAGCASNKLIPKSITASTSSILTPDSVNQVQLDIQFHVPGNYISRRSRLFITPQLIVADSLYTEFTPLVINGDIYNKKINRQIILDQYIDQYINQAVTLDKSSSSFDLSYLKKIQLPEEIDAGHIVAVVSTDGCGNCTGIDTVNITTISNPVTLINNQLKKSLQLSWIEPEFVIRPKIMEGRGVANLQFNINSFDINLSMGNNRQELDDMLNKLSPILGDTLANIRSITINGMASADGSLPFNTILARNRASSARSWIVSQLNIPSNIQRKISVDSRPEGWMPVLVAMTADNNPDSVAVQAILAKYFDQNDDVQEQYIRALPCWKDIKGKYLQKERKVEYIYSYTIKSFTSDDELLDMYKKRPDAFNEEELLRVATLANTDDEKMEVYKTLLHYFPQSKAASNNLAILYLNIGQEEQAQKVLEHVVEYSPEILNTLAASYIYIDDYERAVELLQRVNLPEARYNLGLLKAKQRKLIEAYELLRPFADVNSAVIALSVNKNPEAERILAHVSDKTPLAEYVRSMTAARLEKHNIFYKHIGNACRDEELRQRAVSEADFYRYRTEEAFQKLISQ